MEDRPSEPDGHTPWNPVASASHPAVFADPIKADFVSTRKLHRDRSLARLREFRPNPTRDYPRGPMNARITPKIPANPIATESPPAATPMSALASPDASTPWPKTSRDAASKIAKFGLPLAILTLLLWAVPAEKWHALQQSPKDYRLLTAALLVAVAAMCLSFIRWRVLVRSLDIPLTMTEAFRLGSIGFLLSFVSAGSVGGDLFKGAFLARRRPGRRTVALASVIVDRACGLYGLVMLACVALLACGADPVSTSIAAGQAGNQTDTFSPADLRYGIFGLFAIGTVSIAVLVFGGKWVDRCLRLIEHWPIVGSVVMRLIPALRIFHQRPASLLLAIFITLGVQGGLATSMYLISLALFSDAPTLTQHFVIVPVGMLVSAVPLTPAGVGLLEVAIEAMYRWALPATSKASGTLVALVFEAVKIAMAVIGTLFYWTAPAEVRRLPSEAADH